MELKDYERLQDSEKLRQLELMVPELGRADIRQLAKQVVESIADENQRRFGRIFLGSLLVRVGELGAAEELASQLPPPSRAFLLAEIADKLATRDGSVALVYLKKADEVADSEPEEDRRSSAQEKIACVYTDLKEWERAREIVNKIKNPFDKSFDLCMLAHALVASAQNDLASQLVREAETLVDTIEPPHQAGVLDDIAKVYISLGDRERAHKTWRRAVPLTEYDQDQSKLRLRICRAFMSLGDQAHAREVALMITNPLHRKEALVIVGDKRGSA